MKKFLNGRAIGALFVVTAFLVTYFAFDGLLFKPFVFCSLLMSIAELLSILISSGQFMKASNGFRAAAICEVVAFVLATIFCLLLDYRVIALVMIASAVSDTAAYAIGSIFGKNNRVKALKKVSPNKSWAGFIAAAVVPFAIIYLFAELVFPDTLATMPQFAFTLGSYAVVAGAVAAIGDLLDSATKRLAKVKDSCEVLVDKPILKIIEWPIKSHGGYMDRFDSTALGLVVFTLIQTIASFLY
jgi:phosphatidate cytidylyltransferase